MLRDESWSDRLLGLAAILPSGGRRWAARRAAARGLEGPALRAAGGDAVVLSRLGLHRLALQTNGGDRDAAVARAGSAASCGDITEARRLSNAVAMTRPQRRFLASCVAPYDPRWAFELLSPTDVENRAACALAFGDYDLAVELLALAAPGQDARYLAAATSAWREDWLDARASLNSAFEADGLAPPLANDEASAMTLDAFARPPGLAPVQGPLISVVMPARNAAATLARSAKSILDQTWLDLEVLIVDDHSTDATLAQANSLSQGDGRVRVLSNARTPGAYGARNTGVLAAQGTIVAFQDADDWAHPQRLERQVQHLLAGKGLTVCRHLRIDDWGRPLSLRVFPFVRLGMITAMIRAEAFSAIGLFDEVEVGADSEWLARFDNRFGRRTAPRTHEVGLLALWSSGSLSESSRTGLKGLGLVKRLDYVETWRRRHVFD